MRPLTDAIPKPLLGAGGKPLIVWTIERLARAGIVELVINHAHLGNQIESLLGDGRALGVSIRYSPEFAALETAGGIAKALPLLGDDPILVVNGDIYCDYDYSAAEAIAAAVESRGDLAHLVLVPNPAHHRRGDFCLRAGRVGQADGERLTFAGIGIYSRDLFVGIAHGAKARLAPLLQEAVIAGRVSGECFAGCWMDVGTPQRLAALDTVLRATTVSGAL